MKNMFEINMYLSAETKIKKFMVLPSVPVKIRDITKSE